MSFVLLIGTLALVAAMIWLGLHGHWKLALPVSSPPALALVWFFASTNQPENVPDQFGVLVALVLGSIFVVAWASFGFGFWVSREDRRTARSKVHH